jgi:hypothetical protein
MSRRNIPSPAGHCRSCWWSQPRKATLAPDSYTVGYPSTIPPSERLPMPLCPACVAEMQAGGWHIARIIPPIDVGAFLRAVYGDAPAIAERHGVEVGWDANMRDFGCIYGPLDASMVWRRFYGPYPLDAPRTPWGSDDDLPFLPSDDDGPWETTL